MAQNAWILGRCPHCRSTLPTDALLAVDERNDWPTIFAECADCEDVVNPR